MRSYLKILMVVGLLMLMMPLLLGYLAGPGVAAHSNIIGDHANSKDVTNATCNGCHDIANRLPNDATKPNAHRRHFVSAFLNFWTTDGSQKGCGRCHQESVYGGNAYYSGQSYAGQGSGLEGDLSYADSEVYSTTNAIGAGEFLRGARKQVKPDVCESCHGLFNKNSPSHGGADLVNTNPNGCVVAGSCHADAGTGGAAADVHDAATYINQSYANSSVYCGRCHGALAWYQTTETSATLP